MNSAGGTRSYSSDSTVDPCAARRSSFCPGTSSAPAPTTHTSARPDAAPSSRPPAESSARSGGSGGSAPRNARPASAPAASNRNAPNAAPARPASGVHGDSDPPDSRCGASRAPTIAPTRIPARDSALVISPLRSPSSAVKATNASVTTSTVVNTAARLASRSGGAGARIVLEVRQHVLLRLPADEAAGHRSAAVVDLRLHPRERERAPASGGPMPPRASVRGSRSTSCGRRAPLAAVAEAHGARGRRHLRPRRVSFASVNTSAETPVKSSARNDDQRRGGRGRGAPRAIAHRVARVLASVSSTVHRRDDGGVLGDDRREGVARDRRRRLRTRAGHDGGADLREAAGSHPPPARDGEADPPLVGTPRLPPDAPGRSSTASSSSASRRPMRA